MRIPLLLVLLLSVSVLPLFPQTQTEGGLRSFDEIFPDIPAEVREAVFSADGYSESMEKNSSPSGFDGDVYGEGSGLDSTVTGRVLQKKPGFLVESIMLIPHGTEQCTLLDVYNTIGKTRTLKGRLYHSATRNENVPLFEDVTRIESAKRNTPIDDPPVALAVPPSETIYMRLRDANFGNSFYRGDLASDGRGLCYSLTNYKNLTYILIPVIREERFIAQLYFEPLAEGFLIYGLSGADVSDFISSRIHIPSAIGKRLAVIMSWVADGIRQE